MLHRQIIPYGPAPRMRRGSQDTGVPPQPAQPPTQPPAHDDSAKQNSAPLAPAEPPK